MANLSLNELKQIAEMRCINGFRRMSRERLLSAHDESNESINNVKNFDNAKIKNIRKDFSKLRQRFSKSKIKEFRRSLYITKNQKKLCALEIEEIKTGFD